jgi:hypothetical protein
MGTSASAYNNVMNQMTSTISTTCTPAQVLDQVIKANLKVGPGCNGFSAVFQEASTQASSCEESDLVQMMQNVLQNGTSTAGTTGIPNSIFNSSSTANEAQNAITDFINQKCAPYQSGKQIFELDLDCEGASDVSILGLLTVDQKSACALDAVAKNVQETSQTADSKAYGGLSLGGLIGLVIAVAIVVVVIAVVVWLSKTGRIPEPSGPAPSGPVIPRSSSGGASRFYAW